MSDIRPLAEGYPIPSEEAWRALCEKALKGADFERSLVKRTADGLIRGPLKTAQDVRVETPQAPDRDEYLPWHIRQAIVETDPKAANDAALTDLAGGVSALDLILDPSGLKGVAVHGASDFKTLLNDVRLDLAPVHIKATEQSVTYAEVFMDYLADRPQAEETLGGLGLSPLDEVAATGHVPETLEADLERASVFAMNLHRLAPKMTAYRVRAHYVYEAGGSEAQEIAYAAAMGVAYIQAMTEAGIEPGAAARLIEFSFAADTDAHLTIAKLRAARRVWAQIVSSFGGAPEDQVMIQHATTGARFMAARDPWSNLIRVAAAGFGAAVAGVDALTLRPLSDALGKPNRFARRVARNLQIMLMEESHLGKVADPAAGSFYHDSLSEDLAQKAWSLFQDLEAQGSIVPALKASQFQSQVSDIQAAKAAAYANSKDVLIGINQYPDLEERPLSDLPETPAVSVPADAAIKPLTDQNSRLSPLSAMRFAEPFENLRKMTEKSTKTPKAFLATLGTLAQFNARTSFVTNRLAVAGIITDPPVVYPDIQKTIHAFKASGCAFAIICGTDEAYTEHALNLADGLKAAGAKLVWLAGRAGDQESAYRQAGIDHCVNLRSNILDELQSAQQVLGLTQGEAA